MFQKLYCFFILIFLLFSFVTPKTIDASTILFSDDFETESSLNWDIIQGDWLRKTINGSIRYGVAVLTPSSYVGTQAGDFGWTDYEFSFDFLPVAGADRNVFFSRQRCKITSNT